MRILKWANTNMEGFVESPDNYMYNYIPNITNSEDAQLPSQLAMDLEDSSSDRSDTVVQFRNELKRLSFKKTSVHRRRSTRRMPFRDRVREQ